MKKYNYPDTKIWTALTERPKLNQDQLEEAVDSIIKNVTTNGDKAIKTYTSTFDGVKLDTLTVTKEEIIIASNKVSNELKEAISVAYKNIKTFHQSQQINSERIETTKGINCWRKSLPIEKVGLYIPGGSAPLFSTVLMLGIPAKIAGCAELILCSPPSSDGEIDPSILYTASLVGIEKIFKIGGAQAIAAMAAGTETVPQVYKIFGPGNQYVTKAKELVQQMGTAIDMPAGPSEVLIIADESSYPAFVAADLLSQAEHGADSQVILLSNNEEVIEASLQELQKQVELLPRKEIAKLALENSKAILLEDMNACFAFSNYYAPEHLIIASDRANEFLDKITNAGSVFVGNYSCEAAGDYASGTNHTLPTNGYAKKYSGVSLDSFVKKITFQELTREGIQHLGPSIEILAEAEDLMAHKNAVTIRLKEINNA